MKTSEVAVAVEQWAASTVPGLNTYPDEPHQLAAALPIVIADVQRKRRAPASSAGAFQQSAYDQMALRVWTIRLMVMINPEPAWTASSRISDMTDQLEDAIVADKTLGGRVQFTDPSIDTSFDPAEVEHSDGTVARAATMTITIGEQTEV